MGVIVHIDETDITTMVDGFTTTRRVNATGVCRLDVRDPAGTYRPEPFAPIAIEIDGTTTFTGKVARVEMTSAVDETGRLILVQGQNANARAKRVIINAIIPAGTLKAALTAVAASFAAVGVTIDPGQADGPELPELGVAWQTGEQFLNTVSKLSGWLWEISDDTLAVSMWPVGSRVAPATFNAANGNIEGSPSWEEDALDYCNGVWVIFGGSAPDDATKTDRFEGDGAARIFEPRYWVKTRPGQVYDEQAGEYRNVGLKGTDTLFEWVWDEVNVRLEQLAEAPPGTPHAPLTAGQYVRITYAPLFPMAIFVDDAAEIAARATPDDPGHWGRVVTSDATTDLDAAQAIGVATIRQSAVTPQRVTLPTRTVGNDPGEVCTVTVPEQDLSGSHLIESEEIQYLVVPGTDPADDGGNYLLLVRLGLLAGGERIDDWIAWWKTLAEGGPGGGVAAGASGGTGTVVSGRTYADLGGSRSAVVSGATLSQPMPEYRTVYLDPAWYSGGVATIRAEVQVLQAGTTVKPRLANADTLAVVGEGSATSATTWERQVFSVVLPAAGYYLLLLERNNGASSARGVAYVE